MGGSLNRGFQLRLDISGLRVSISTARLRLQCWRGVFSVKRNNLHSFTLWPEASDIVSDTQYGRKSQLVSKAIIWFSKPREVIVDDGGVVLMVNMSEQIMDLTFSPPQHDFMADYFVRFGLRHSILTLEAGESCIPCVSVRSIGPEDYHVIGGDNQVRLRGASMVCE